jgi:hypothetical protein
MPNLFFSGFNILFLVPNSIFSGFNIPSLMPDLFFLGSISHLWCPIYYFWVQLSVHEIKVFGESFPILYHVCLPCSGRNHLKINISHILNPNLTKWLLNPAHQDLSNNIKGTFQLLWNFQLWFNLIFREEIIQYSRTFALQVQTLRIQAHAPLLVKSLPNTPRTWSEASRFGGPHNYKTNYLLHR